MGLSRPFKEDGYVSFSSFPGRWLWVFVMFSGKMVMGLSRPFKEDGYGSFSTFQGRWLWVFVMFSGKMVMGLSRPFKEDGYGSFSSWVKDNRHWVAITDKCCNVGLSSSMISSLHDSSTVQK